MPLRPYARSSRHWVQDLQSANEDHGASSVHRPFPSPDMALLFVGLQFWWHSSKDSKHWSSRSCSATPPLAFFSLSLMCSVLTFIFSSITWLGRQALVASLRALWWRAACYGHRSSKKHQTKLCYKTPQLMLPPNALQCEQCNLSRLENNTEHTKKKKKASVLQVLPSTIVQLKHSKKVHVQ